MTKEISAGRLRRKEQRKAEMERGAKQTKINMAQALITEIRKSIDPDYKFSFELLHVGPDPKLWAVRVNFRNGQAHVESWWEFPSDELKAKIMLFGGRFENVYSRGQS